MPVQIQNDVDAVYEPVITIADTGEVLTEAQIYDTTLALANRIEYVRSLSPDATETPEAFVIFREDFFGARFDETLDRVFADTIWLAEVGTGAAISHQAGTARRPGLLQCACSTDSEIFVWSPSPHGSITLEMLTIVVQVEDDAGNVASSFSVGLAQDPELANGGTDSLLLYYSKAFANWRLIVRRSSVQTLVDTGVPFVSEDFVTCRFIKNGNDIDVELNGSIVHTAVSGVDKLTGENFLRAHTVCTVADAAPTVSRLDFFQARSGVSTGSRAD